MADQNWDDDYTIPVVYAGEEKLPCQVEKELSNLALDWRKHFVFSTELQPSQMNRFDCKLVRVSAKPEPQFAPVDGRFVFTTEQLDVVINTQTGLMDRYRVNGVDYLKPNAFLPLVIHDNEDPWGMTTHGYTDVAGQFTLMSSESSARFSGVKADMLDAVRMIEDGEVRTVIEAVFAYGDSSLCLHYKLPKQGTKSRSSCACTGTKRASCSSSRCHSLYRCDISGTGCLRGGRVADRRG